MSDETLRAALRSYQESMSDETESAYWTAWERAGAGPGTVVPWHVRCPAEHPRPGDVIHGTTRGHGTISAAPRMVLRVDGDRVTYRLDGTGLTHPTKDCSVAHWLRWALSSWARVALHAGRSLPRTERHHFAPADREEQERRYESGYIRGMVPRVRHRRQRVEANRAKKITGAITGRAGGPLLAGGDPSQGDPWPEWPARVRTHGVPVIAPRGTFLVDGQGIAGGELVTLGADGRVHTAERLPPAQRMAPGLFEDIRLAMESRGTPGLHAAGRVLQSIPSVYLCPDCGTSHYGSTEGGLWCAPCAMRPRHAPEAEP